MKRTLETSVYFARRATTSQLMRFGALLVFSVLLAGCREELPLGGSSHRPTPAFQFMPGDYFSFDNWKLDFFGFRIPSSYYRNSWTVVDTGANLRGAARVVVVIDSTFDSTQQLARLDSLLFRFETNGDVFQYGFLASLIAERESLSLAPQWDRIAAFSQPTGTSWVVARIDTGMGASTQQTVLGTISPTPEYVGPVMVDGEERAILAYRIEITKPKLDYTFWLSDAPTSFPRAVDESDILRNVTLRELKTVRRARR